MVRLTDEERVASSCGQEVEGAGEKVRRAQILVKADADGPATRRGVLPSDSHRQRGRVERRFQEPLDRA